MESQLENQNKELVTESLISPTRSQKTFSFGLGSPVSAEAQERDRDITIRPKAPASFNSTTLVRAKTLPTLASPIKVRHALIESPTYVRTSQNIGAGQAKVARFELPTVSGGSIRRLSLSETVEEEITPFKPITRSNTLLPSFAPPSMSADSIERKNILDLPANPKNWLPSQLAVFISHTLSQQTLTLHPLLAMDISNFVRSSGLNGRTFLRLKNEDLEEMGINIKWREILIEAKRSLNEDILAGRIVGFGVDFSENSNSNVIEEEELKKEDWKKSWKSIKGKKSRGRVTGMARNHENGNKNGRSDSISSITSFTSTASIDLTQAADILTSTPLTSNPSNSTDDSNILLSSNSSKAFNNSPQEGQQESGMIIDGIKARVDEWNSDQLHLAPESTRINGLNSTSSQAESTSSLATLFGIDINKKKRAGSREENLEEELLTRRLGNGSLILVKRSQLEELGRRMNEVEAQLALALNSPALGLSPSTSFSHSLYETSLEPPAQSILPVGLGSWILSAFSDKNPILNPKEPEPSSFVALTGYVLAASVGIGIVAGEVVVKKVFGVGFGRR